MPPQHFKPAIRRRPQRLGALADSGGARSTGDQAAREATEHDARTRVAAAAAGAYRLEDVLEQTAEAALEATGAASLSISRWERAEEVMRTLINVGELGPGEERFPVDEIYPLEGNPLVEGLLRNMQPYYNSVDDPDAPRASVNLLRSLGKESDLAVPVAVDGQVWGEVWATTSVGSRRFDQGDVRFLKSIAGQLAIVITRAEHFSKVSQLAYEDSLTGLANRRAIEERLEEVLAERAAHSLLTVMLCDVDRLKLINDDHGHEVGDRALCRIAEALKEASAGVAKCTVGRLAGDEFCILIEDGGLDAAGAIARATREMLRNGDGLRLSVSFGAAVAEPDSRPSDLLRTADDGQYAAKRRGGGMLCTTGAGSGSIISPPRRLVRHGDLDIELEQAAAQLLDLLDVEMAGQAALDRVVAVAVGFATALNCAAWSISHWREGSDELTVVSGANDRDTRLRGLRIDPQSEVYRLEDFPDAARALRDGRGGFLVYADDQNAESGERALLRTLGFAATLVAVGAHEDGAYLIDLYGDERTADMAPAAVRLQLLLRAACAS